MNSADLLIVGGVALSAVIGVVRGFVTEVMALIVWVVATVASTLLGSRCAEWFDGHIDSIAARIFLGYALVFIATLLVGAVVTWLLRKLVEKTGLSGTDRLLGAVFGVARGMLLVVVIVLMLGLTPMPQDRWWRESGLLPLFVSWAKMAQSWLPVSVADRIRFDVPAEPEAASKAEPERNAR